jgi:RNA polymerase sigma-70 factor, ECF subfamily
MQRSAKKRPVREPCGLRFSQLRRLSDDELMCHLQAGHDDALAVIFDRYRKIVLGIAIRMLRDDGEAEDVTQTVFLDIFRAASQFDPAKGTTKNWLLQYAYHRSMNRRQYLNVRKFYQQTGNNGLAPYEVPQRSRDCWRLCDQECSQLVRQALATLNQVQKATLELAFFDGFSMQEIADKTGESLLNVRHHYYRGLNKLRHFLRGEVVQVKLVPSSREVADVRG